MQPSASLPTAGNLPSTGASRPASSLLGAGRPLLFDPLSDEEIDALRAAGGRSGLEVGSTPDAFDTWLSTSAPCVSDGPAARFASTLTFHDVRSMDKAEIVDLARAFERNEREAAEAVEAQLRTVDTFAPSYFDLDEKRPGLPEDVGALVETLSAEHANLSLVNLNPSEWRSVVVQGGAYAEHTLVSVERDGEVVPINAPTVVVELAPGSGSKFTFEMKRYAGSPTLSWPWDSSPR